MECFFVGCRRRESYDYNNRLQLYMLQLGMATDADANACTVYNHYSGTAPGSCPVAPPPSGSGNNGNVQSYRFVDNTSSLAPDLDHTASFTYDGLNRLTNSTASGAQSHNLTYSYDRYGNGTCTGGTGLCTQLSFDTTKNQISGSGYTYDAAGNLTQDGTGSCTYTWDGEGRQKTVATCATLEFTYNALGQRAEKKIGTSTYREYVYDGFGRLIGTHKRDAWLERTFPLGGTALAKHRSGTKFMHYNYLGSMAFVTDAAGTLVEKTIFYPWGQRWASGGTIWDERFASMEQRDPETTLDPTLFRMYSGRLYRWLSPDPVAGSILNPQSLNRYAYVLNNPANFIDPLGLDEDGFTPVPTPSYPWPCPYHPPPPCRRFLPIPQEVTAMAATVMEAVGALSHRNCPNLSTRRRSQFGTPRSACGAASPAE